MPTAAAIGAAGSVGSALIGAGASKAASGAQTQADMMGLMLQQQRFQQAQSALNPYIQGGQSVLPTLQNLLTPGQSAQQLAKMPGFQFQSQWGNLAATNQLAAQGLGGSTGPLATALSQYNQGLAGTYYQNTTNALQNYANMGAGAGAALAGTAMQSGQQMGQSSQAIGGAQAQGILGSANALSGGLGGLANAGMLSSLMSGQSGSSSGLYGQLSSGLMGLGQGGITGAPGG